MLTQKMEAALNKQVNAEMYSSYLYLSMAAYLTDLNLPGFATWMKAQAQEEMVHAMKLHNYIEDALGRVTLAAIEAPATEWESPLAVFEAVQEHEQKVTRMIHNLVDVAEAEKDKATRIMLEWFVTEQVEEESNADANIKLLKLTQGQPQALLMADRELGARPLLWTLPVPGAPAP